MFKTVSIFSSTLVFVLSDSVTSVVVVVVVLFVFFFWGGGGGGGGPKLCIHIYRLIVFSKIIPAHGLQGYQMVGTIPKYYRSCCTSRPQFWYVPELCIQFWYVPELFITCSNSRTYQNCAIPVRTRIVQFRYIPELCNSGTYQNCAIPVHVFFQNCYYNSWTYQNCP